MKRASYGSLSKLTKHQRRDHINAQQRALYADDPVRYRKYAVVWRKRHPNRSRYMERNHNCKQAHGIDLKQKKKLLHDPGGVCGICGTPNVGPKGWQIDHNHQLPKGHAKFIRGILCGKCNRGGGQFNDDPLFLQKAAEWFRR